MITLKGQMEGGKGGRSRFLKMKVAKGVPYTNTQVTAELPLTQATEQRVSACTLSKQPESKVLKNVQRTKDD